MATPELLNHARWTLDRQLSWIAAADAKVGVVVTLHVAMLGGLGAAYTATTAKTAWVNAIAGMYALLALASLIYAAIALWPRVDGPKNSMVYFGCVAKARCEDYVEAFKKNDDSFFVEDLVNQIHRNAEIALKKISYVGLAMKVAFVGSFFWVISVALLVMPK